MNDDIYLEKKNKIGYQREDDQCLNNTQSKKISTNIILPVIYFLLCIL